MFSKNSDQHRISRPYEHWKRFYLLQYSFFLTPSDMYLQLTRGLRSLSLLNQMDFYIYLVENLLFVFSWWIMDTKKRWLLFERYSVNVTNLKGWSRMLHYTIHMDDCDLLLEESCKYRY